MKLLNSNAIGNKQTSYQVESGQYGLFLFRFTGTIPASDTTAVALADLGTLNLNINGREKMQIPFSVLSKMNNVYGGVAKFTSTAGNGSSTKGAFEIDIILSTGFMFDRHNIYDIAPTDKFIFRLDFSTVGAKADAGSVSIHAKPKPGVQNYILNLVSQPVLATAAGSYPGTLVFPNISQIYLDNPTIIDQIQLVKDGKVFVDDNINVIQSYSDWIHQLEATNDLVSVEFVETGSYQEARGVAVSYNYHFTTNGTLNQYVAFIEETPMKAQASYQAAKTRAR